MNTLNLLLPWVFFPFITSPLFWLQAPTLAPVQVPCPRQDDSPLLSPWSSLTNRSHWTRQFRRFPEMTEGHNKLSVSAAASQTPTVVVVVADALTMADDDDDASCPLLTFILLQLASFICASWLAGVREFVLPNGDVIIVDTARFSLDGVLLNEKARPTCGLY